RQFGINIGCGEGGKACVSRCKYFTIVSRSIMDGGHLSSDSGEEKFSHRPVIFKASPTTSMIEKLHRNRIGPPSVQTGFDESGTKRQGLVPGRRQLLTASIQERRS